MSRALRVPRLDRLAECCLNAEKSHTWESIAKAGCYMAGSDKRKQSLYFPEEMLKEIQEEATRQDRSLSWIVQKAWKISRKEIMKYPSVNEFPGEDDERGATE